MKKLSLSLAAVCSLLFAGVTAALAAGPSDYQATGPVLAVTDTTITIQKGKEKWEVGKDANTKGATDLKVGDKVTIHYTMTATTVEAKPATPAKGAKKDAKTTTAPTAPTAVTPSKPTTEATPAVNPAAQ